MLLCRTAAPYHQSAQKIAAMTASVAEISRRAATTANVSTIATVLYAAGWVQGSIVVLRAAADGANVTLLQLHAGFGMRRRDELQQWSLHVRRARSSVRRPALVCEVWVISLR